MSVDPKLRNKRLVKDNETLNLSYHIELRREMFSSPDRVIEELTLRCQQLHALAEKYAFLTPLNLLDDKYVSNRSQLRRRR